MSECLYVRVSAHHKFLSGEVNFKALLLMLESYDLSKTCRDYLSDDYLQLENLYLTSKVNFDLRGQNGSFELQRIL